MLLHGIRGSTTRVNPSWSLTRLVVDRTRNDKCDHTSEIILGDLETKKKLDPKLSCPSFSVYGVRTGRQQGRGPNCHCGAFSRQGGPLRHV